MSKIFLNPVQDRNYRRSLKIYSRALGLPRKFFPNWGHRTQQLA